MQDINVVPLIWCFKKINFRKDQLVFDMENYLSMNIYFSDFEAIAFSLKIS